MQVRVDSSDDTRISPAESWWKRLKGMLGGKHVEDPSIPCGSADLHVKTSAVVS